jgi:mannose-6-phosphate isomerase-like protein (cupin superfamily)
MTEPRPFGAFDLDAIVKRFPPTSDTMLIDTRLTDEQEASCRVFRIYTDVPGHYHATCDEYLLVIAGRGTIFIGDSTPFEVAPGQLLFLRRNGPRPDRHRASLRVPAADTPRCHPRDITFVNPADGTPTRPSRRRILLTLRCDDATAAYAARRSARLARAPD